MVLHSQSAAQTVRLGKQIGSLLQPGDLVALVGELGAGKTCLIRGLAAGLGVDRSSPITSPTFTFIQDYRGRVPFHHIDLYRLSAQEEVDELGLEEYFQKGGVTAIEWADKIRSLLPKEFVWIRLRYQGAHHRSIVLRGRGKRYAELLWGLRRLRPEE